MENISRKIGMAVLMMMVAVSGLALIFEDQFAVFASFFSYDRYKSIDTTGKVLKIAYLFSPTDLNPFSADLATQKRLLDVYEPLIRVDENLNMQPVLAASYGLSSETNWEFRIRQGVKFHDGKTLDVEDVLFSFNQAKARPGSVANDLVDSVESIGKSGEQEVMIVTKKPDPLLLIKLSKLPILPDGFNDFGSPVGTGPYEITESSDLSYLSYRRFSDYWGKLPFYGEVVVLAQPDRNKRVNDLLQGETDILADVPPDSVDDLQEQGLVVKFMPSLEVGFVLFNMLDETFSQRSLRLAVAQSLNRESFLDLAFGHANVINQFVSSGVFGYDPTLAGISYDPQKAREEVNKLLSGFEKVSVSFYYPQSLKLLGQYFREQLEPIGFEVELKPLSDEDLQNGLAEGKLGFYYLGWRNDTADALPFLQSVLHSRNQHGYGIYNGMNYENDVVDQLIEQSETNFNLKERLADMQKVMRVAVEEDLVGVPLFETQSIFAMAADIQFSPRVDSLIFPSSIRNTTL